MRTDGAERLGVYCPGPRCGTDLRAGTHGVVQAWCEPDRQRGRPGRTATVRLTVRNAGNVADSYRVEPIEQVDGEIEINEAALAARLAPGSVRTIEIRYTPRPDRVGLALDVASRFGVPGADLVQEADDASFVRYGVALRVVSRANASASACAAFAVDVPGRLRIDTDPPATTAGGRRWLLMSVVGAMLALVVVAVVALVGGKDEDSVPTRASDAQVIAPAQPTDTTSLVTGESPGKPVPPSDKPSRDEPSAAPPSSPDKSKVGGKVTPAQWVTLPDLTGKTSDEAESVLKELGLTADGEFVANTGPASLTVLSTVPTGGTKVAPGSQVFVRLSDGRAEVPDVVGEAEKDASGRLKKAGFTVVGTYTFDENTPLGQVISSDPPAGKSQPYGSQVTITVCAAPSRPR
ncbi:PASTA domain-containing protein [Yinghuangia sp. ASG 101]|uniref:PASTA domain-containing protein n=1 Tax=Yinghuangia sp. ASG 101 TaxID=2896848 RepID=UPI001E5CF86F|nr:PASTA domain-containing protein [Yinghuangia sp. ASG 101]UGQ11416.1 PASTA domain-containing protein [Yinghuangia sp. ASG 101]